MFKFFYTLLFSLGTYKKYWNKLFFYTIENLFFFPYLFWKFKIILAVNSISLDVQ